MATADGKPRKSSEAADLVAGVANDAEAAFWVIYDRCIELGLGKQPSDGLPWSVKDLGLAIDSADNDNRHKNPSNWRAHKNVPNEFWAKKLAALFFPTDGDCATAFLAAWHKAHSCRRQGKAARGKARKSSSGSPGAVPSLDLLCANVEKLVHPLDNRLSARCRPAVVGRWLESTKIALELLATGTSKIEAYELGDLASDFEGLADEVAKLDPELREELADLVTIAVGIDRLAREGGTVPRPDETTTTTWPVDVRMEVDKRVDELLARVTSARAVEPPGTEVHAMLGNAHFRLSRLKGETISDFPRMHIVRSAAEDAIKTLRLDRHDPASTLGRLHTNASVLATRLREVQEQVISELPDLAIFRDLADGPELVVIPGGMFLMGSPLDEEGSYDDEGPQREVKVPRFALGRYPVTFEEYDRYSAAKGIEPPPDKKNWGRGRRPVINMWWDDARGYCAWLSSETGKVYRLPSEAEWEYACRAGTVTRFSWGDAFDAKLANADENHNTTAVGDYPANPWKLHDMHGNVWEWCEDDWHVSYEGAPSDGSAWVGDFADRKRMRGVLRGGSWSSLLRDVRSASRDWGGPGSRSDYDPLGFRLARVLE